MTDMDKMMIEKVARAIAASFENGSPDIAKNMRMDWQTWEPEARAAISAYNPDDRLREALEPFARYYDLNDCDGREGNIEVPISDLRGARDVLR